MTPCTAITQVIQTPGLRSARFCSFHGLHKWGLSCLGVGLCGVVLCLLCVGKGKDTSGHSCLWLSLPDASPSSAPLVLHPTRPDPGRFRFLECFILA